MVIGHFCSACIPHPASFILLFCAAALSLLAACADYRQVFLPGGEVAFTDADCYARMTRVRAVCEQPGAVLREHLFENYPDGTRPHTTVPFDYAVFALQRLLQPFYSSRALDLAGAWVSPLFGLAAVLGVWLWGESGRLPGRWLALLVVAASPFVAHGFELGRPDHQSLIMACAAWALAAEWALWRAPSRGWGVASGGAWALGLWTSLYEPLVLLALVLLAGLVWNRPALFHRARLPGLAAGGAILLAALLIEGWRVDAPPGFGEANGAGFFAAWSKQIGELASIPPWSPVFYGWTGWGLLAAPVLLLLPRAEAAGPRARANLLLLVSVFLLTCWQVRWGYFLPLVYALSLPCQFESAIFAAESPLRRWSLVISHWSFLRSAFILHPSSFILLFGLLPLAREWHTRLRPPPERAALLAEQRADTAALHDAARFLARAAAEAPAPGDPPAGGILAPWWLSPALAYWSGQPALAGSSHESLPGIVDAARFYLTADSRAAADLLRRRRVRWVVAYEPDRVLRTAAPLLGQTLVSKRALGLVLYQRPELAPPFLRLVMANPAFKVYEVQTNGLP